MTYSDYKKYSLDNLENWLHDAISCGDATPQEIYNVIIKVVKDEYYTYKKKASESYELLALLNGSNIPDSIKEQVKAQGEIWDKEDIEAILGEREYYESSMPPWGHSDLEYLSQQDKMLSCNKDDPSPECKGAWNDFWEDTDSSREYNLREAEYYNKRAELDARQDKVKKWVLPTQVDGLTGDVIVNLPDDLLDRAGLKEGDVVEWIDRNDGSFEMRKVNGTK